MKGQTQLPADAEVSPDGATVICRSCGQPHRAPTLARGERANCVRCGTVLARRGIFGRDAGLAYTLTGLCLIGPALALPFATISKFGDVHASLLFTGVVALWQDGMVLLAVWAAICGIIAPILLLTVITRLQFRARRGTPGNEAGPLERTAQVLEHWSMPEVHILAVLVAFVKLGSLVNVAVGPGLWCYAGMATCVLLAWHSFDRPWPAAL